MVEQLPPGAVDRGTLQRLQSDAAMYCGMLVCFCRKLKWDTLATLFAALQVDLGLPTTYSPFVLLALVPPLPLFAHHRTQSERYIVLPVALVTRSGLPTVPQRSYCRSCASVPT